MKPYINEEINGLTAYTSVVTKVREKIKKCYSKEEIKDVEFITVDFGAEKYSGCICLWSSEPEAYLETYWSESIEKSQYGGEIRLTELTTKEEEIIKNHWDKLIWRVIQ